MGHCPEIFNSVFFMILTIWTLKVFPNLALICSKILFRNNDTAESDYLESLTLMSQKYFGLRSFYWSPRFSPSEILLYFSLQHPLQLLLTGFQLGIAVAKNIEVRFWRFFLPLKRGHFSKLVFTDQNSFGLMILSAKIFLHRWSRFWREFFIFF